MQKRMLGALVGIALLMTLCMNVLAAYTDTTDDSLVVDASDDIIAIQTAAFTNAEVLSAPELLETAYHTVSLSVVSGDIIAEIEDPETIVVGPQIFVNGDSIGETSIATLINNSTYISIHTIVGALYPNAAFSWQNDQLVVSGEGFHLTARPGDTYMVVNERYLYVPDGVRAEAGSVTVPIRTVCNALGASTQWDVMTRDITVTTTGTPLVSGSSYYNSDDLYWMSRIITAESRNQPLAGKIAVGSVIMNRVSSARYPNSVYGVIFDGYQFSPTQNGSIYNSPTVESIIAAKLVLEGAREAGDSIFFNRAGMSSWAARNKTYVTTIADHAFYK